MLGWAQLNSNVHWKDTVFHIQEQLLSSGLFAKSKEGTIYYLNKHFSRSGVKLPSWLLITLQGDQQGKLSVSNHLQHTCQWEKKEWISVCLILLLKYQLENNSEDLQYSQPVSSSQGPSTATPKLRGAILDLCTLTLTSCTCTYCFFSSLEVTVGKGYCTPRSYPSREPSHVQGGWLDPSLHNVGSKQHSLTFTKSMASPGSEFWRTHPKFSAFI